MRVSAIWLMIAPDYGKQEFILLVSSSPGGRFPRISGLGEGQIALFARSARSLPPLSSGALHRC
eukprot:2815420-Alexandrium_andersonii.AAC.1